MQNLIRTEVQKLRTIRSPWLLLAASPLFVAAGISGLAVSTKKTFDTGLQSQAISG